MIMKSGKFISLEGGEGSGKSTCAAYIKQYLERHNIAFISTREPGGTPLAEQIRSLVLSERDEKVHDLTELLLMFAARAQHVREKIQPALAAGVWVLSDRFVDSSFVYQGLARDGDMAKIATLSEWAVADCLPSKTLLFDVPVDLGLSRVQQRQQADRLDKESVAFHETVRQGFLERAVQSPERFSVIDAAQPLTEVYAQIDVVLLALLAEAKQA